MSARQAGSVPPLTERMAKGWVLGLLLLGACGGHEPTVPSDESPAGSDASLKRLPVVAAAAEQLVTSSGFAHGSSTINVPLFRSLIQALAEDRRWVVLDLGAARPQTIALLSRYRCRLDIADLGDAAETRAGQGESVHWAESGLSLRGIRSPEPTDIVFCWDFLNYLEPDQLTTLMASIATRCGSGALVHALIVYSDRRMQQWPGQWVPIDDGSLLNLSTAPPERRAPRYSHEDLRSSMPTYAIERVRLLANGMQEYLFRL